MHVLPPVVLFQSGWRPGACPASQRECPQRRRLAVGAGAGGCPLPSDDSQEVLPWRCSVRHSRFVYVSRSRALPLRNPPEVQRLAGAGDPAPAEASGRPTAGEAHRLVSRLHVSGGQLGQGPPRRSQGRVASGRIVPPRRLCRHQPRRWSRWSGVVLQWTWDGGAVDQGGQKRGEMDAAELPRLCRQSGQAATVRPGVQPGKLPAAIGVARWREALVDDHSKGETHQDRGEGGASRPVGGLSDGGGCRPSKAVPAYPGKNPATSVADGGIGMTTGGVKSLRNVWGDGVGLFLCGWEAVENAKMERMAVHISTIRRPRTKKNAGPNSKPRYIMQNHRRRSAAEVKWEIPA